MTESRPSARAATDDPEYAANLRRATLASSIGSALEYFDFALYGLSTALIFNVLFFPQDDPAMATVAAFATFGVGFLARPFGGLFFGVLGDKLGRKWVLVATIVLMGGASTAIGLLPTYAAIGVWAPILLVLMRLLQGFGAGAEQAGATVLMAEYAPVRRRGFFSALPFVGIQAGTLLAAVVFGLITLLPEEQLLSWGWRVPFLASALLLLVGLAIRLGVNESPEFIASREQAQKARRKEQAPVLEVLRTAWRPLLLCIGANTLGIAGVYFTNTFMISYTTQQLHLERSLILECLFFVAIIQFCVQPLAAWLSEKVGATRFLALVALLAMASPYPMFVLVSSGQGPLIVLGIALAAACMASFYAVIAGYVSGMFATRVRYTAISLAYQICGAIAGGLTPLIGTWLAHTFSGQWWPMAAFYTLIATISLVCVLALARQYARSQRLELA